MTDRKAKTAFIFPGYGSHRKRMGHGLLEEYPFAIALRQCDEKFRRYVTWSMMEELKRPIATSRLEDTLIGYPCSMAVEIALVELLKNWGIEPDGVVGHSGGETVAAYTSGLLNLEDTVCLIWNHYLEMESGAGKGMMAHISLPVLNVQEILRRENLEKEVFISLWNSPKSTVVSGWKSAIERLLKSLADRKIFCRPLNTMAPFHSPLVEYFREVVSLRQKNIGTGSIRLPLYSSLLGRLSQESDFSPFYWTDLMIKPVQLVDVVRSMIDDGFNVFVEISAHPVLTRSLREILEVYGTGEEIVIETLKRDEDDKKRVLEALARLSLAGVHYQFHIPESGDRQELNNLIDSIKSLSDTTDIAHEKRLNPSTEGETLMETIISSFHEVMGEGVHLNRGDLGFFDMGMDSVTALKFCDSLSGRLGYGLPATLIFDYPDLGTLHTYLSNLAPVSLPSKVDKSFCGESRGAVFSKRAPLVVEDACQSKPNEPIAIIGMACRFPGGANSPDSFWSLMQRGGDTVGDIPLERWDAGIFYSEEKTVGKSVTRCGHFLSAIDIRTFDASFFKISPKEAESMDPQQRLLLEVSVEALENAAIPVNWLRDKPVGIFVGICQEDYKRAHMFSDRLEDMDPYSASGSMFSAAAGRLSFFFGARGPSVAVDSACSSSIVAFHLAARSLRSGECNLAIAGGVNMLLTPHPFICFSQLGVLARDGRCKSFDDHADGYGRGEGCGILVLKRLADARRDKDNILALIKGSAINHDGASMGFTAPNGIAQQEVINKALTDAGIGANTIDYVEAHGSGTSLGDPIEINALAGVYGPYHSHEHPLWVGAVKTNIGHLEGAAGAAGVIKTILALQHKSIPGQIHFSRPNALIDWDHIPIQVVTGMKPWSQDSHPRRAGVSSFGFSGANAHIILEEAPECSPEPPEVRYPVHLLKLSARDEEVLKGLATSYRDYLTATHLQLADDIDYICYTAATGRMNWNCRLTVQGKTAAEIVKQLELFLEGRGRKGFYCIDNPGGVAKEVVFLFTGQGSQYPGMGRELYEVHPVFRQAMDKCDGMFQSFLGVSLVELLYQGENQVDRPLYAQPAIFSLQYSLTCLWESFGIRPMAVLGHSIGEYAAAWLAGIFSLEDAVKLVAARARLMETIPCNGNMVGILASEETVKDLIKPYPDVSIAAINTGENITISGSQSSMSVVLEKVKQAKIFVERLNISHPFHSVMMEPYVEQFRNEIMGMGITFSPPHIRFIPARDSGSGTDLDYWATQLREPVRFYPCLNGLAGQGYRLFLEIGGTATLAGLAGQALGDIYTDALFLPSLRKGKEEWTQLLSSLVQFDIRGEDIDWHSFYNPGSRKRTSRVILPTYPFHRKRYWRDNLVSRVLTTQCSTTTRTANDPADRQTGMPDRVKKTDKEDKMDHLERMEKIIVQLKEMVYTIAGINPGDIDGDADLLELGLDSLMLVELRRKIAGQYGVDVTLNQFFMELTTPGRVAKYIMEQLPGELPAEEKINPGLVEPLSHGATLPGLSAPAAIPVAADGGTLERIMALQLETMKQLAEKQLETLKQIPGSAILSSSSSSSSVSGGVKPAKLQPPIQKIEQQPKTLPVAPKPLNFSSTADLRQRGLNPQQQRHLEALIGRYTERTRSSKEQTQAYRRVLSDSKATVGFNLSTKEMLYPVIGKKAAGAYLWDIDNNKYIDITMGFGVYLFGHHPGFLKEVMAGISADSTGLGPRSYLVGEVAEMVARFTHMERVTFTNTGTEAVMAAIRLARAATGRSKIAMFARSYHGHSDNTLAVSSTRNGKLFSEPVSPGIPHSVASEVLVLDYLEAVSLEILEKQGHELAAVLVEPIQSRYPGVNPGEFLRQLREVTRRTGTLLIFDEMITGFRVHPGGAQAYFNVEADICTYGKIVGGGLPIGVIAGKSQYMDHIDGGYWEYGDASYPIVERTFFGGTFCQYHEAMVAAHAVLKYLEQRGPQLQENLNNRMDKLAVTLNQYFKENEVNIQLAHSSTIFRFDIPGGMDLFYYHLLEKGVYVWEWRCCFLSEAHSDDDLNRVVEAVKETVEELRSGGFSLERRGVAKPSSVGVVGELKKKSLKYEGRFLPMSSVQRRLFALSQTTDGQRSYHMPIAMHIQGPLDVERVKFAIHQLIQRHESLRTGLEIKDNQPVQQVYEPTEVKVPVIFSRKLGAAIHMLVDEAMESFDLSKPPLMRVTVTETAAEEFIFVTNFHHAIMDGTSLTIFVQNFLSLYQGNSLIPVKMQYRDYVRWEDEYRVSGKYQVHKQYWLEQLKGGGIPLELPIDYPRPEIADPRGHTFKTRIGLEKTAEIKILTRKNRLSLNMFLLAMVKVLLFKLTGQDDICVGIPANVRGYDGLDITLGMFTNTLVIRSRPQTNIRFSDFLDQIKITCLQALSHQEYPYEDLAAQLGDRNDMSRNPLFDVAFIYENGNDQMYKIPGLTIKTCDVDMKAAAFDIVWSMIEEEGTFNVGIGYRTNLYKADTIQRWYSFFLRLLDAVLKEPQSPLANLEMMTTTEKEKILYEFNDTVVDYPGEKRIEELFIDQVEKTPDCIALVEETPGGAINLSYKELERRSRVLAFQLRENGVGAESIVALMTGRTAESVMGALGILKCGGCYMPIDPDYPGERITYMLKDSSAHIMVTLNQEKKGNSRTLFVEVIKSDKIKKEEKLKQESTLAYIMYTSGSTGGPKGVMVEHRNVVRLVKNSNFVNLSGSTRILQTGAPVFDATTFEIWGALLNGGLLVLVEKEVILNYRILGLMMWKHRVNTLWLSASLFNLLEEQDSGIFSPLCWLLVGGDVLSPQHINRVRQRNPHLTVINGYGPTENTTFSTCYRILDDFDGPVPIGRPISNSTAYIVDISGSLLPVGIAGELWVGGEGVARGYLNNPELTATKFITPKIPFPVTPGIKPGMFQKKHQADGRILYNTGDLARWLPDGNIEFLGRRDQQVKIRGFRIETSEIERVFMRYSGVHDVVVVPQDSHAPGQPRTLCAYIVSDPGVQEPLLLNHLANTLPDYMIPSHLVYLAKIPLTANGKVDRHALPQPGVEIGPRYTPPRDDYEKKLLSLWAEVLHLEEKHIGIHANFFRLGGHSLNAALLLNRINETFAIELKLRNMFELSSIEKLAQQIRGTAIPAESVTLPEPQEKKEFYPQSSAQKRLFLVQQIDESGTGYNMPVVYRIQGSLDITRLRAAIEATILRHESLRTSFALIDNEPVQVILDHAELEIETGVETETKTGSKTGSNISPASPGENNHTGYDYIDRMICHSFVRPFDLSRAPLLRVGVIVLRPGEWFLLLDMHHIISDGLSIGVFLRDFRAFYSHNEGELPELPVQYKDFSNWQRNLAGSDAYKMQEIFWLNQFQGEIPVLHLPTDMLRPPTQRFEGNRYDFVLDSPGLSQLNQWYKDREVTLYMALLMVYAIFLYKVSGQEDVVVGSPTAGRRLPHLDNLMGMFVNTLALRLQPGPSKTIEDFLQEVKKCVLDAYDNQDYQYEELVERVVKNRDLSRNPLFDTVFALENRELNRAYREMQLPGLTITPYEWGEKNSKFDLTLFAEEGDSQVLFRFEYSTHLFKPATVERFPVYFRQVLVGVLETSNAMISGIEIIPGEEKRLILEEFNATVVDFPREKTLHGLFEEQAAHTPDGTALVTMKKQIPNHGNWAAMSDVVSLTYKELNQRADIMATQIRSLGAGIGTIVALMADRSIESLTAILAILKTGAAYLPIDPEYPGERIRYLLADSAAPIMITPELEGVSIKNIISNYTGYSYENQHKPGNSSGNLAYVMYTSGSSGKPKGVMVEHVNVVRLVINPDYVELSGKTRILQTGAPVFDATTFEIWGALLNGGLVVLVANDIILDAHQLKKAVSLYHINMMWITSPLFCQLEEQDIQLFDGLEWLLVGGDVLPPPHINRVRQSYPHLKIINLYGPTENTTFSTYFRIDRDYQDSIPIGRPIHNSSVLIISKTGGLQPIGITGELWVGGDGVARGYLNNPELTAEKFLSPRSFMNKLFTLAPGGACSRGQFFYKTGDLGRWLSNGDIDFQGRLDEQVKIRGFRIEPDEIRERLIHRPDIKDALVTVRKDRRGEKYLCAYIVPADQGTGGQDFDGESFKLSLIEELPGYMIPSCTVVLERMPLTQNGKIDRNALPEPALEKKENYVAPRDDIESRLVKIWEELLDLGHGVIGIDDHFFKRGGHSLKAMILTANIYKIFGVQVPLTVLFETMTIRRLADYIRQSETHRFISIPKTEQREFYPLSPAQKRLFATFHQDPDSTAYNMPTVVILEGELDKIKLEQVFNTIINRHEVLRTSFTVIGEQPVQQVYPAVHFSIRYYDAVNYQDIIKAFVRPFDLHCVPLLRVGLIQTSQAGHILLFDMPHIVSDARSQELLIEEMMMLYRGEPVPILNLQYRDFTQWLTQRIDNGEMARLEAYWDEQFKEKILKTELPLDYLRPRQRTYTGKTVTFEIQNPTVEQLKEIANREAATMFMVTLAVFYTLLLKITGSEDVIVGTPVAGRVHPDLDHIMGMFVNTLALRNFPTKNCPFIDFLRQVKNRTLDAFDNQEYPFEDLVEKVVGQEREPGRHPLFDMMFSFSAQRAGLWEKAALTTQGQLMVRPYEVENLPVKFDLLFSGEDLGNTIRFTIEYSTELFKEETIQRLAGYFKDIALIVASNETVNLKDIGISHTMVNVVTGIYEKDMEDFGF